MLSLVPGRTLADKLDNAWVRLQTHVNCVLDSNLDKLSKDVNPGIKQVYYRHFFQPKVLILFLIFP